MKELTDQQAIVLEMTEGDGLTADQIAIRIGICRSAVCRLLARARAVLSINPGANDRNILRTVRELAPIGSDRHYCHQLEPAA